MPCWRDQRLDSDRCHLLHYQHGRLQWIPEYSPCLHGSHSFPKSMPTSWLSFVTTSLVLICFCFQLTDDVFVTEVHHITPDGKDSGVVYSEMQVKCAKFLTKLLLIPCAYLPELELTLPSIRHDCFPHRMIFFLSFLLGPWEYTTVSDVLRVHQVALPWWQY